MLELGVNMMDNFSANEFYDRASYIVKNTLSMGKKVAFISPYTHFRDYSQNSNEQKLSAEYHQMCSKIASENNELIYIDGRTILFDINQLSTDLIHPSMLGHNLMAERLSKKLTELKFLD